MCLCVSEKRTQHDDNDDGDDDAVLLKLLLPHVSSFILHQHAHITWLNFSFFFFPHSG